MSSLSNSHRAETTGQQPHSGQEGEEKGCMQKVSGKLKEWLGNVQPLNGVA